MRIPNKKWLLAVIPLFIFVAVAKADNTYGELQEQKEILMTRIAETSTEYQLVAESKAEAQEWCNIVSQKEAQLKVFTSLNESRRSEIKLIDQKLDRLTQPLQK